MKFRIGILFLLLGFGQLFALSFAPGTVFLEAKDQASCEKLGGTYMVWYEEVYCTRSAPVDAENNDLKQIKGKTLAEARHLFPNRIFRIVERDGEPLMVTKDYVLGRINVSVQADLIVSYYIEGDGQVDRKNWRGDLPKRDEKGARLATCSIKLAGNRVYQDYCYFLPEKGNGGFSIYPPESGYFYGKIAMISMWKTSKISGDVRALNLDDVAVNSRWGSVTRSESSPACWVSDAQDAMRAVPEFEICVYAVK